MFFAAVYVARFTRWMAGSGNVLTFTSNYRPITLVAVDAAHGNTGELFEIGDDGSERMAVIQVAVQRLGVQHELSTLGRGGGRGNRHLAAELVGRASPVDHPHC